MPEGDTLFRLAAALRPLEGATVAASDLRWPSLAAARLEGARLEAVRAEGKHLLLTLASGSRSAVLLSHLRMEGRWEVLDDDAGAARALRSHRVRAVLTLEQEGRRRLLVGTSLGELRLLPAVEAPRALAHLGEDPLSTTRPFDPARAAELLTARLGGASDGSLGAALLDQRRIAGLGNVLRAEVLFLARLSPWTPLGALRDRPGAAAAVVGLSRDALIANRARRRKTTPESWAERFWVYGRDGRPCLYCGTAVRRAELAGTGGERTVFWCPRCQPEPLPDPPRDAG